MSVRLFVAFSAILNAAPAVCQTIAVPPEQVFGDWRVACLAATAPKQCQMVQAVSAQTGEEPVFLLTVSARPDEKSYYGVITVPVGVYLSNGIEIFVDQRRPLKVLYEVCDQKGCYAGFKVDGVVLSALKAGHAAKFRVWTAKTQAVEFPVSLKGFTAGWGALQKVSEE